MTVERLDYSKPPPSWKCRRCSECQGQDHHWMGDPRPARLPSIASLDEEMDDEDGEPVWACKHCKAEWPFEAGDMYGENVGDPSRILDVAWAHYKRHNDPPGMRVVKCGQGFGYGLVVDTRDPVMLADGEEFEAEARDAAWAWHDRRLALTSRADEPRDCDACGGEAVSPDVINAHEDACEFVSHDIHDDGGGRCNSCGTELPPCPECGPYHGLRPPCNDIWPRCLTWSDEQVAEVELWLVDSTAEMPEVFCG